MQDTAQRVQETFLPERYLVVVWPEDEKENALPVWKGDDPFEGGVFVGWAFVIDQTDGTIACQYPLEVESSEEIGYREGGRGLGKLLNEKPETALKNDFEDNVEAALEKGLPQGVKLVGGLGRILK